MESLWLTGRPETQERSACRGTIPPNFRRKVLDLLKADRTMRRVAADRQISDQTIYNWRRQERIDVGLEPGITSNDQAELVAARRRLRETLAADHVRSESSSAGPRRRTPLRACSCSTRAASASAQARSTWAGRAWTLMEPPWYLVGVYIWRAVTGSVQSTGLSRA
ncbi:hypothetical protein GCM10027161_01880 [Microbispora hainanensis]